jgi:hypothetical protein
MNPTPVFNRIFILGLLFTLLPFFLIAAFTHPAAFDDFQFAMMVFKHGSWGAVDYFYHSWSGRYMSTAVAAYLNPLIFKSWLLNYKLFPVVALLLTILAGSYFFSSFRGPGQKTNWFGAFGFSIAFLAIFLFSIPTVAEIFYWFTGASVYLSGILLFFLLAGSVSNFTASRNSLSRFLFGGVALLAIAAIMGTNESIMLAVLFLSFIAVVYSFITKQKNAFFFLLLFVVGLLAAIVSIKSPGNALRASQLHGSESMYSIPLLITAGVKSCMFSALKIVGWLNSFTLILFFVLFLPIGLALLNRHPGLSRITKIHPLIGLFLSLIFFSVQAFPSFLGVGDMEPRVWNSVYFFFLLACLYNLMVLINYFKPFLEKADFRFLAPVQILTVLLLIFSGEGNVNKAYLDLGIRARGYDASLKERYALIERSKGSDVVVSPIMERQYKYPKTIFSSEITTKPDASKVGMAAYFGIKSIRLSKDPER